jgi:hypothetical protein
MARKLITDMSAWPALTLEGNLIAPAMVAQIAAPKDDADSREGYGVRKGLTIREEISTAFRVGQSHFDAFSKQESPSPETTRRFVREFLKETFGFDDLAPGDGVLSFISGGRVPVVVVPPVEEKLDRRSPTLSVERSRSPAFALQDYLNEHDDALWGLVTNGALIRLIRDNASLTRPAYIEADLAQIFANEDAASFAILWLMIHRSRFGAAGAPATDCALERWREAGSREGEVARDRLASQVQVALQVLGSGFLEANPELAAKLKSGEVNLTEWFNELLRFVYRLIFLMVAEDRNLLHPEKAKPDARKLYAEGYSLAALRAQCYRAASWDKHHDRYEGIKIVFHALAHGQEVLALPALGGLFSDDKLPHLETARLRNKAFMEALYRLSWLDQKTGMVPVNWRAMETEELGSVYESLLELQPQLGDDGKTMLFASEVAEQKGNQRKTTGSYYTPDSLVQALLDTALDPVLDKTEAEADDPAKALLKLSVIDPACGSGHFLLAAARRIATRVARIRADGTPSLADFRHALRDVARSCLHGVDRNPMAVELTKVALWIETVDPGLPLGFFDAQIRCGDALLGVFDLKVLQDGIPDAAYKPLTGDDKDTAKYYLQANRESKKSPVGSDARTDHSLFQMKPLAIDFSNFRDLPEDTVAQINVKVRRLKELRDGQDYIRAKTAADLYVAAFLLPKIGNALAGPSARTVPITEDLWLALRSGKIHRTMQDARKVARRARSFHWAVEFFDIMQSGGFDVVLGNPPWELIDTQSFGRVPNRCVRQFISNSGRFPLTSLGRLNSYSLFCELIFSLVRSNGSIGIIVPSAICYDEANSAFFSKMASGGLFKQVISFENEKFIFPDVAHVFRFCMLIGHGLRNACHKATYTFFCESVADAKDHRRLYDMTFADICLMNPNTKTAPVFRSREDFHLVRQIYDRVPVLQRDATEIGDDDWCFMLGQGQPIKYDGVEIIGNDDTRVSEGEDWIPVYESKMLNIFDHRWGGYRLGDAQETRVLPRTRLDQYQDPSFLPMPRFFADRKRYVHWANKYNWHRDWLVSWRDITGSHIIRTMICSVLPANLSNSTVKYFFPEGASVESTPQLVGNMSSIVFDYIVRQKLGGAHLSNYILKQLPLLPPHSYTDMAASFVKKRVVELSYTSWALKPFALEFGCNGPPFAWNEDRRAHLRADLDAFYARAYGLNRDELRYILDPADVKGPDYPSETFRVLKEREIRHHGEYRTRRLVLAAWDRMEADGEFAAMGM